MSGWKTGAGAMISPELEFSVSDTPGEDPGTQSLPGGDADQGHHKGLCSVQTSQQHLTSEISHG